MIDVDFDSAAESNVLCVNVPLNGHMNHVEAQVPYQQAADFATHPLHLAVASAIQQQIQGHAELIRDPACGGNQQLPLFVGTRKSRGPGCVALIYSSSQAEVFG